ncbi:PiggyBac transposable element-derived protein 4 [Elysia marginata]|uniref:PiggyBac transposable element-derived protein 4 n=1 Tax=Elysia marginata TaxID=1093978 RepID=A0AAV4HSI4_9GAST|nr:PiggyBac transposable element-derived protein 4 [Elysia marginata]
MGGGRVRQPADRGDNVVVNNDDGWTRTFVPSHIDLSFNEDEVGPVNIPGAINDESACLDFLSLFMEDDFWQNLTAMTNLRAQKVREAKPNSYHAKNYKDASVEEMKAFIGLWIYMEYICIKPSYRDYWANEDTDFIDFTPGFRTVMTRNRFLTLWTFLHVVDEADTDIEKTDRIYKSRTSYVVNAEIYTGATDAAIQDLGAVGNTVVRLLTSCKKERKAHIVVMDGYYNSVTLARYMLNELHTGLVGTLQQNRKFFPKSLKVNKMQRGESQYRCQDSIICMVGQDHKPITFISNYHDPTKIGVASQRNKDPTLAEVTMPQLVEDYNRHMGGSDKNDQMTRLNRSRRHNRWPRCLFIKFFMWACYNSFVIYVTKQEAAEKKPMFFTRYIQKLCLELIGDYRSKAIRRGQLEPCPQRLIPGNHWPEIPEEKSNHVCAVCMEKHNQFNRQNPGVAYKDNPNKKVKTNVWCSLCTKYLCVKYGSTFWVDYHTKVQYWRSLKGEPLIYNICKFQLILTTGLHATNSFLTHIRFSYFSPGRPGRGKN